MANIELLTKDELLGSINLTLPASNEIVYDDLGKPSVMVKVPKMSYADLGISDSTATHPAFIINGVEVPYIYISKYQNIIENGRAYSLPYKQPQVSITIDNAKIACEAKGDGWHLMTNAEWAAIALWCYKNECQPHGNNNGAFGDYYAPSEKGAPMPTASRTYTATGSGPKNWYHNNDFSGIADLNGNVSERVGGLRLVSGEIQVIPNNDAAMAVDQSANSTLWKAIAQDGTFVEPGTEGTLKFSADCLSVTDSKFSRTTAAEGVNVPDILKALALFPIDQATITTDPETQEEVITYPGYSGDYYYVNAGSGEKMPYRGGYYSYNADAGVFSCFLIGTRTNSNGTIGFRSAYVPSNLYTV